MQTEVLETSERGYVGEVATLRHQGIRARVLAALAHEVHINVGGNDNGVYSFEVSTPDGFLPNDPALVSFTAAASSIDDIVTGLADDVAVTFQTIDGQSVPLLTNVVNATANLVDDDVELVAVRTGEPFTVTLVGNPMGNLTQTTVVDGTAASLVVGIAMVAVDDDTARVPQAGDTDADILGVLRRGKPVSMPDTSAQDTGSYESGDTLEIVSDGDVWVLPEEAVTVSGPVFVRVNATGNEQAGAFRASQDGTAQVTTATPTVANTTVYRLQVDLPAFDADPAMTRTFEITSDGTATATEICDAFRTQMAADAAFTARIVASGTTTLVLTAVTPGQSFTVLDVQEGAGDWTSIVETTAAVADCVLMTGARWLTDGSATLVAKLSITRA